MIALPTKPRLRQAHKKEEMKMKLYHSPEVTVLAIAQDDILTVSGKDMIFVILDDHEIDISDMFG